MQQVSRALTHTRNLVTHFHHSPRSSHLLKEKQSDLKYPSHSLVQQVTTRWNSADYMLQGILEQQQPLCATLHELRRPDLMPTDAKITAMEIIVEVMEPIAQITEIMGQKHGSPALLYTHCCTNSSTTIYLHSQLTPD